VPETSTIQTIPLAAIKPNPHNPRRVITDQMVDNMAASLKSAGLKNPIKVTAHTDGTYQVLSGHIRLAGAQKAGLESLPALVLSLTPEEALLEAILDNQGQPMSWLETYMAAESLLKANPELTQKEVAARLGLDPAYASRGVKLLKVLTDPSRGLILENLKNPTGYKPSENAVFALTELDDPQRVEEALKVVIAKGLTAPQTKKLVETIKGGTPAEAHVPVKATPKPKSTATTPAPKAAPAPVQVPTQMSEAETLAWNTAAGISVITQIKAKIKKSERPSIFEALLLTGHTLWKITEWLLKHTYHIVKTVTKVVWKLFKESMKSTFKALGPTVYRVTRTLLGIAFLAVCAYVAWDSYAHGFHPWHALSTLFTLVVALVRG